MAVMKLTLRYKSPRARFVYVLMLLSLPVWEIGAPIAIGYIIGLITSNLLSLPFAFVATIIPLLLLLIVASIAITAVAEDNRIHLSKDGLSFPLFFLPHLKYRRARLWSDLKNATVTSEQNILLNFTDGSSLVLNSKRLGESDIEQLLLAIEMWGTNCERSEQLIEYQNRIQSQGKDPTAIGYTQMWEEELARRFQTTAFIPLEPEHRLCKGRIKVLKQLAFGGLSAIYLAQENDLDLVVIKEAVVPQKAAPEMKAEAEKHLLRESEILSRFNHPRAAQVLDHFVEDGRHYLKLEYINGTDLRQYVKQNGPVDQVQAIKWGIQILDVLQALHDLKVIHRDLTPENLVLRKDEVILIDFGAANEFVGTATGTIVGKQAFMPPEQLRGKTVPESDLYAFGGTMHFLLTGKDPLPLSTASPKSLVNEIDDELDAAIEKCSAFEAEDRFHSAKEAAEALSSILHKLEAAVAAGKH